MLLKTLRSVFVAATQAIAYRPYSKSCPPPPPPPHVKTWQRKKVCGTITTSVFFAHVSPTTQTRVEQYDLGLPGFPPRTWYSTQFDPRLPMTEVVPVNVQPYCVMVNVYE